MYPKPPCAVSSQPTIPMEILSAPHESLHLSHHQMTPTTTTPKTATAAPLLSFPLPSQSSATLPTEPLLSLSLKTGYPGILSLHNYRKFLSHPTIDSQEGKTLRRKNAASNLHDNTTTTQMQMGSTYHHYAYPFSASSTASSPPPPLSPSYSPSAVSEQLPEVLDGFGYPVSPFLDVSQYEEGGDKHNPYRLLDTFRDRLERFPDPDPDVISLHGHSRARSDSVLFKARRARKPLPPTTVVHQGTSFEIINPHESLNVARIVSYIEDVDAHSSSNHQRDSYLDSTTTHELLNENDQKAHDDLVGDSPHHPMPSISERLEERDIESCYSPSVKPLSRPLSMIRPWTAHNNESELGEPGPQISFYDDDDNDNDSHLPLAPKEITIGPTIPNTPVNLAALYDIGYLPEHGKGTTNNTTTTNPTTIIYSQHKPLRKKSILARKRRKPLSSSNTITTPSTSTSVFPVTTPGRLPMSNPLRRLRGIAHSLRRKTFPRGRLS